jgi:hypothetical protein
MPKRLPTRMWQSPNASTLYLNAQTLYCIDFDISKVTNLADLFKKDVLLVEEEDAAGVVEEAVVHHLFEQLNALPHPEPVKP